MLNPIITITAINGESLAIVHGLVGGADVDFEARGQLTRVAAIAAQMEWRRLEIRYGGRTRIYYR